MCGLRHVVSGLWRVKPEAASGGVRKVQNKANWSWPLIACSEGVNIDGFGIPYPKRSQFRVAARREIGGATHLEAGTQTNSADRILDYATSWHACGAEWNGWVIGVELAIASEPQRGGLGSWGVDLSQPEL